MPDKANLIGMLFSEEAADKVDEVAFLRGLGDMTSAQFAGVLMMLLQIWGKASAQHAFDMIAAEPERRDEITVFLKVTTRCAALDSALQQLVHAEYPIDPSPNSLATTVDAAYEIVRRNSCRK